jgi:hypothetical protein
MTIDFSAIGESIAKSFAAIMTEPKNRLGYIWNAEGKKLMAIELGGLADNVHVLEESLMRIIASFPTTAHPKLAQAFKDDSTKQGVLLTRLMNSIKRIVERFCYMAYGKSINEIIAGDE